MTRLTLTFFQSGTDGAGLPVTPRRDIFCRNLPPARADARPIRNVPSGWA